MLIFTIDGCFTLFGGDQVEDTPEEQDPYFGCNSDDVPDTCPQLSGLDPIHNYMDYSDDACLTGQRCDLYNDNDILESSLISSDKL
jgi:hypothetical protein